MKPFFEEPGQREARPDWQDVPAGIISQLQALLKEKIIGVETAWGGYSPSAAFAVTLESGKKVFIKGAHPGEDAHGTQTVLQEVTAYQTLPFVRLHSPAYLGTVSDGSEDGWRLAVFEYIDAPPTLPWTPEKISSAFGLLSRLHFCGEKDIPPTVTPAAEKNYVEKFLRPEGGWIRIGDDPAVAARFFTLFEDEAAGEKWLLESFPRLCEQQARAAALGGPAGIIHQDLRADNFLFDKAGRAYLIDWPNACRGPVVLDLAAFLPAVSADSGVDAGKLLALYSGISGKKIPGAELAAALASLSGHLADNAYRAVPPKLPRLRWMQKSTLWAMLRWAVVLMDIPPPPRFRGLRRDG